MTSNKEGYGIGEVQEMLKTEFPDITISKLRFLEKENLISPARTQSGYRKYSKADVKLITYILRLQREEYLPLSVIKKKIQDLQSGKALAGDLAVMSGQAAEALTVEQAPVPFDLAPVKLGLPVETINEMVEFGIVRVKERKEGKYFSTNDMKIMALAKEFFTYGVEPRHLRMFVQFSSRKSSFIEQIIRPQFEHKDPNTRRIALKDMENLISLCQMLEKALLDEELSEYLPRPVTIDTLEEKVLAETSKKESEKPSPEEESRGSGEPGVPTQEMFPDI
ncbi:MAG: MerR family transcriptional regulator [Actinomycetota bacterium]|nr:MerR family transcriptional regulator [Actinomycetota bacterium]